MFVVDIKWNTNEESDDSFSYDSFSLALNETERFLEGRVSKPVSINIFEVKTKFSEDKKLVASLRTLR